jgi:hypothetical protein
MVIELLDKAKNEYNLCFKIFTMIKITFEETLQDAKKLLELLRLKKYTAVLYKSGIDDEEANLLIISEEFSTNMEKRQAYIFSVSSLFPHIEVIGWTYDEFKKRSKKADDFLSKVRKIGTIIKDDYQIFE